MSTVCALLLLFVSGFVGYRDAAISQSDFAYVWSGPRSLLDGANPYDPISWAASTQRLGTSLAGAPAVYSYPPYVAAALLPLGALPLSIAFGLWTWGGLLLAIVALRMLLREFPHRRALSAIAPVSLVLCEPAIESLYGGQWSHFVFAATSFLLLALARGRFVGVAVSTLALLAKPQSTALALVGLAWRSLRRGESRIALTIVTAGALLAVATAAFAAAALASWLTHVPAARAGEQQLATLSALLGPVAAAGVLIVALVIAARADTTRPASASLWVVLSLLAAPYAHPYDQLVLLAPLIVLSADSPVIALAGVGVLAVLPWALFALVSHAAGFEPASALVPLVIYALVSFAVLKTGPVPERPVSFTGNKT